MFKKIRLGFTCIMVILTVLAGESKLYAAEGELKLYAKSAVLIDGSNGRILYGKNENSVMPMASTTKVMTLIMALEYGDPDDTVTISGYAAMQPDVQLNAAAGEVYCLGDLLHAMMMQSYNDVAVAVAEYVADVYVNGNQNHEKVKERTPDESRAMVKTFAILMNKKAEELGCVNTYFITPNGLDAQDENGIHSTTAYELAKICAYAVANEKVIEICTTKSYYFTELNGKRQVNIGTTDRFLDMMDGAVGLKTGFTGNAGYCFAGALKRDGKTLITVVLGCGWPPNKNYKWADTRILMNYGLNKFFFQKIFIADNNYREISVKDGVKENLGTYIPFSLDMLIGEMDRVDIIYTVPDYVKAPITVNQEVGKVNIYINDKLFTCFPVLAKESVEEKDYFWCVNYVIKLFFK